MDVPIGARAMLTAGPHCAQIPLHPTLPDLWALPPLLPAGWDPHRDAHDTSGTGLAVQSC